MPAADPGSPDAGGAGLPTSDATTSRRREPRQQVKQCRAHVRRVVDAADPEGPLALGAPLDEYDPEVDDLTRLVQHGEVTADSVLAVWERWFGPGSALQSDRALLEHLTRELLREDLGVVDQVADQVDGDRLTDSTTPAPGTPLSSRTGAT